MNKFMKKLLLSVLCVSSVFFCTEVLAQDLVLKAETDAIAMDIVIKDNFIKAKYASAENRFLQGNVKASYDDFTDLITKAEHDDYVFLVYGMRMAEYGFFD